MSESEIKFVLSIWAFAFSLGFLAIVFIPSHQDKIENVCQYECTHKDPRTGECLTVRKMVK